MQTLFKKMVVAALTLEARAVLWAYRPHIVAVTGSVGKTATKDAIFAVVSTHASARKSDKSFNSDIGVPLSILGVPNAWRNPVRWLQNIVDGLLLLLFRAPYPAWLVLEVGADRPNDIRSIVKWLPVDVAVITRLPDVPVHVEFFDSPQDVVDEKASLIKALAPDGTLVLYGDDDRGLGSRAEGRPVLTFGFSEACDVRAESAKATKDGMRMTMVVEGKSADVTLRGALGLHALLPLLAAAAVGHALGYDFERIVEGLGAYAPPPGRMRLVRGLKDTLIIDDTYNSSPAAALAALDALESIPSARRVAVLGDMLELGRHSVEEHRKVGARAAQCCGLLAAVGFRARDMAQGALDAGMPESNILEYEDARAAGNELQTLIQPDDIILVKGSQSMRMERVVEELMAEPEQAPDLLVRQDKEWKRR